jgi:hypothetical protein
MLVALEVLKRALIAVCIVIDPYAPLVTAAFLTREADIA